MSVLICYSNWSHCLWAHSWNKNRHQSQWYQQSIDPTSFITLSLCSPIHENWNVSIRGAPIPSGGTSPFAMKLVKYILNEFHKTLLDSGLSQAVVTQIYAQVFYYISAALFNNLVRRKELCTNMNGFLIRMALSNLEDWVAQKARFALPAIRYDHHANAMKSNTTACSFERQTIGKRWDPSIRQLPYWCWRKTYWLKILPLWSRFAHQWTHSRSNLS